jgi:hypothetical protein
MTLERAWSLFKLATAPTPPLVKKITRALDDVKAGAGLLNDLLPNPPQPSPTTPNP